jgi:hypothetical protein
MKIFSRIFKLLSMPERESRGWWNDLKSGWLALFSTESSASEEPAGIGASVNEASARSEDAKHGLSASDARCRPAGQSSYLNGVVRLLKHAFFKIAEGYAVELVLRWLDPTDLFAALFRWLLKMWREVFRRPDDPFEWSYSRSQSAF